MPSARRPSTRAFHCLLLGSSLFLLSLIDAGWLRQSHAPAIARQRALVSTLQLTDLCLFTEARYTRHLSQADLHSAFQDHPLGLEKFPSGALVAPPAHLIDAHERLVRQTAIPD